MKACFDWNRFDVANFIAHFSGEDGLHTSPLNGIAKITRDISCLWTSSSYYFSLHRAMVIPVNMLKASDLDPKDNNIQIFTKTPKIAWSAHLEQDSVKDV